MQFETAISQLTHAVEFILPEVMLLVAMCVMFLAAPFLVTDRGHAPAGLRHRWGWLSVTAILAAGYLWWTTSVMLPSPPNESMDFVSSLLWSITSLFHPGDVMARAHSTGPFQFDVLTVVVRGLSLMVGLLLVLMNWNQVDDSRAAESHACILAICAGVNLVAVANDLVMLFLALELISVPTYLFLLIPKRDALGQEATLKYFLLSVFSSAFLLFGLSYVYGLTGTTNLYAIQAEFRQATAASGIGLPPLTVIAAIMIIAGLAFRVTAVPFHFYAPDVFQGCPTPGAAMLSVVPKIAGFIALLRLVVVGQGPAESGAIILISPAAVNVLWWLAFLTMFLGNLLALAQTNLRRMLAYSSIAHAGYMLVGLSAVSTASTVPRGEHAILFYLVAYGMMTLGLFSMLAWLSSSGYAIERLDDLAGMGRLEPMAALLMALFLFSMTGLPPTGGFTGKLNLFLTARSAGSSGQWLSIWLALNAAISAGYYVRLIGIMFLREPTSAQQPRPRNDLPPMLAFSACAVATVVLFFSPNWLWTTIQKVVL